MDKDEVDKTLDDLGTQSIRDLPSPPHNTPDFDNRKTPPPEIELTTFSDNSEDLDDEEAMELDDSLEEEVEILEEINAQVSNNTSKAPPSSDKNKLMSYIGEVGRNIEVKLNETVKNARNNPQPGEGKEAKNEISFLLTLRNIFNNIKTKVMDLLFGKSKEKTLGEHLSSLQTVKKNLETQLTDSPQTQNSSKLKSKVKLLEKAEHYVSFAIKQKEKASEIELSSLKKPR